MFSVSEAEAAAIRAAHERGGELAAAIELRRYFAGMHRGLEAAAGDADGVYAAAQSTLYRVSCAVGSDVLGRSGALRPVLCFVKRRI
jgi:hypothetical protein